MTIRTELRYDYVAGGVIDLHDKTGWMNNKRPIKGSILSIKLYQSHFWPKQIRAFKEHQISGPSNILYTIKCILISFSSPAIKAVRSYQERDDDAKKK